MLAARVAMTSEHSDKPDCKPSALSKLQHPWLRGSMCTGHYNGAQPAGKTRAMAVPVLLAGAAVGVALLLLSAAALVVRRRQMAGYAQLQAQDAPTTAFVQPV